MNILYGFSSSKDRSSSQDPHVRKDLLNRKAAEHIQQHNMRASSSAIPASATTTAQAGSSSSGTTSQTGGARKIEVFGFPTQATNNSAVAHRSSSESGQWRQRVGNGLSFKSYPRDQPSQSPRAASINEAEEIEKEVGAGETSDKASGGDDLKRKRDDEDVPSSAPSSTSAAPANAPGNEPRFLSQPDARTFKKQRGVDTSDGTAGGSTSAGIQPHVYLTAHRNGAKSFDNASQRLICAAAGGSSTSVSSREMRPPTSGAAATPRIGGKAAGKGKEDAEAGSEDEEKPDIIERSRLGLASQDKPPSIYPECSIFHDANRIFCDAHRKYMLESGELVGRETVRKVQAELDAKTKQLEDCSREKEDCMREKEECVREKEECIREKEECIREKQATEKKLAASESSIKRMVADDKREKVTTAARLKQDEKKAADHLKEMEDRAAEVMRCRMAVGYDKKIREKDGDHQKEVERVKANHQVELGKVRAESGKAKAEQQVELGKIRAELGRAKAEQVELGKVKAGHQAEVGRLRADLGKITAELGKARADHQEENKKLVEGYQAEAVDREEVVAGLKKDLGVAQGQVKDMESEMCELEKGIQGDASMLQGRVTKLLAKFRQNRI